MYVNRSVLVMVVIFFALSVYLSLLVNCTI